MSTNSLVRRIESEFSELPMPGMTLREAQLADHTLDREISEVEWQAARQLDAAVTWKDLEATTLIECDAALSHITEEGFVYYIPAYMRLALRHLESSPERIWDAYGATVFHLTHLNNHSLGRFKRFSDPQIDVVVEFLREVRRAGGFEAGMALEALDKYWETGDARQRTIP
jgi:hypothetical protein